MSHKCQWFGEYFRLDSTLRCMLHNPLSGSFKLYLPVIFAFLLIPRCLVLVLISLMEQVITTIFLP